MILIDTNSLIILVLGLINPQLISTHKRTSIYEEQDYYDLVAVIGNFDKLVMLPNVWTEVDNLLNKFNGDYKYSYIKSLQDTMKISSEKFIQSIQGVQSHYFYSLGLTDSLLLEIAKDCSLLITSDSCLSDHAVANNIKVFDVVKNRNDRM